MNRQDTAEATMHTPQRRPAPPPDIDSRSVDALHLCQLCEAHLEREVEHLEATGAALQDIHAAAVSGKPQTLADALQRHQRLVGATEEMRVQRESFRNDAGVMLGIPGGSVTLRTVAGRLPSILGERVLERRQDLLQRAGNVDRQARAIALLSHYFLEFLQRFFIELTGGRKSGRYGPEGLRREPVCGFLLQAQG